MNGWKTPHVPNSLFDVTIWDFGVKITFLGGFLFWVRTSATSVGAAGAPRSAPAPPGASSPPTMAIGWTESCGRRSRVSSMIPKLGFRFIWALGAEVGVLGWV